MNSKPSNASPGSLPQSPYFGAAVAVAIGAAVRLLAAKELGPAAPFLTLYPAVALAAWFGGFWCAMFAAALSCLLAATLMIQPTGSVLILDPNVRWAAAMFVVMGAATGLLGESQRRSVLKAEDERRLLDTTLRSIGDAVLTTDRDGSITLLNAAAEQLTGWSAAEAQGKHYADVLKIVDERSREPAPDPIERVLREGSLESMSNHSLLLSRRGPALPIEESAAPIRDEEGEVRGVVLVFRDVSERQETEQRGAELLELERRARAESEAARKQLEYLAEASRILAASLDYEATLQQVASLTVPYLADWCEFQVVSEDGSIHSSIVEHPDPVKVELAQQLNRAYPTNPNARIGAPNVLRTGETEIYAEIDEDVLQRAAADNEHLKMLRELGLRSAMVVPIKSRDRILGALTLVYAESGRHYGEKDRSIVEELARRAGSAIDNARLYTEARVALRNSAETAARHRDVEDRLSLLLDATSTLVGSPDRDLVMGRIVQIAAELLPADAHALWRRDASGGAWLPVATLGLSERYFNTVVSMPMNASPSPAEAMIMEDLPPDDNHPHLRAMKEEGIVSLLAMPISIAAHPRGTLVFYHRSHHRFEDNDRRVAAGLANIAAAILTITDLYESLTERADKLDRANEIKTQFIAMLAHELRNPLFTIASGVRLLWDAPAESAPFQRAREVVTRQAAHMSKLVDQLLDVTRFETGKIPIKRGIVDLRQIAVTTCLDHQRLMEEQGLHFEQRIPEQSVCVWGDETRLRQLIGNLLQNASKFTQAGGKVCFELTASEGMATLIVSDTGIGMSPSMLDILFEPFAQADGSIDRPRGGLGLGLALVRGIAEQHQGRVCAESAGPGLGSTFTVELPLSDAPTAGSSVVQNTVVAPLRILLIEDNVDAAAALADVLELQGHQVRIAHTGTEGVEAARAFLPQAVLCDLGLPGMNGFEVAKEIRDSSLPGLVHLIAISGYGQEADIRHSLDSGFDEHLTKPIDHERLNQLLANDANRG